MATQQIQSDQILAPNSTWVAPTLLNSWTNFGTGFAAAGYRKLISGEVILKGVIAPGTTTAGTVLFTLPAGYRPADTLVFVAASSTKVRIDVASNGDVKIMEVPSSFLSLDGIRFYAEVTSYLTPALLTQVAGVGIGATMSTFNASLTVAATSEVLIVTYSKTSLSATGPTIAGCGATWSLVKTSGGFGTGGSNDGCWMWVGVNPTVGAGTVTVTMSTNVRGMMWASRWSGLSGTTLGTPVSSTSGANVTSFTGPAYTPSSLEAGRGLLLAHIGNGNADGDPTQTYSPSSTGWVKGTTGTESTRALNTMAWKIGADVLNSDQHYAVGTQAFSAPWAGITAHFEAAIA